MKEIVALIIGLISTVIMNEYMKKKKQESRGTMLPFVFFVASFVTYVVASYVEEHQMYRNIKKGEPDF
jgi:ABC-type arginine transport system permease subunit